MILRIATNTDVRGTLIEATVEKIQLPTYLLYKSEPREPRALLILSIKKGV